jgi:hypothetical protein
VLNNPLSAQKKWNELFHYWDKLNDQKNILVKIT